VADVTEEEAANDHQVAVRRFERACDRDEAKKSQAVAT
jgi:hypothetical protein